MVNGTQMHVCGSQDADPHDRRRSEKEKFDEGRSE
jgi:hypothetical protein